MSNAELIEMAKRNPPPQSWYEDDGMSNDKAEILTEAEVDGWLSVPRDSECPYKLAANTIRQMAGLLEEVLVADGWWQQTDPQKVDDACKRQIHAMGQVQAILARYKGEKL